MRRTGLHIRGFNVDGEVRRAVLRFAAWLRKTYDFPIRVPVYLSAREKLRNANGKLCSASFFAPFDKNVEPYIRVATGDYATLKRTRGRNNALAAILCSLAHEIVHYQQWLKAGQTSENGAMREASRIVQKYAKTVAVP